MLLSLGASLGIGGNGFVSASPPCWRSVHPWGDRNGYCSAGLGRVAPARSSSGYWRSTPSREVAKDTVVQVLVIAVLGSVVCTERAHRRLPASPAGRELLGVRGTEPATIHSVA